MVDYCIGPVSPGVFVVVRTDDAYVQHEMAYLQMGDGPYFSLYRPYHLASIEAPLTVYEIALDRRPSLTSEYWTSEVGAEAKRPLKAGELITGIGTDTIRGVADPAEDFVRDNGVPLGVLAGARLKHDVPVDHMLTYDDVELDEAALIVQMRRHQKAMMRGESVPGLAEFRAAISR